MKINSRLLGFLIVIILFGGIFTASALNLWRTESSKIPQKIIEGDFSGEYNPEDIRGSFSFGDISELFNIPLEVLRISFGLPKDINVSEFKNKDLESLYSNIEDEKEIGNGSVKFFVALYKGLPYRLEEDTYLLDEAVAILKEHVSLSKEQIEYLEKHSITINSYENKSEEISNEELQEHDENENVVKGKTTFNDILDWGISKETIKEIIDGEIPNPVMTIRDYCTNKGIQFSAIKEAFQNEIDNKLKKDENNSNISNKLYNDGAYITVTDGYRPGLTVSTVIKDDKIESIKIIEHRESTEYYEEPFEIIPNQIIENQTTDVDAITGATRTSDGIIRAVKMALEEAKK